jgi:hypothetical protein
MLGNTIVVLNSAHAAADLLDKRSSIYSDRTVPPMILEHDLYVTSFIWLILLTPLRFLQYGLE